MASPVICYALDSATQYIWDYHFGYELLMLNGLLTFAGLWLTSVKWSEKDGFQMKSSVKY
jgi:hypothetical protein